LEGAILLILPSTLRTSYPMQPPTITTRMKHLLIQRQELLQPLIPHVLQHRWFSTFPDRFSLVLVAIVAVAGADSFAVADVYDRESIWEAGDRMPLITHILDPHTRAPPPNLLYLLQRV